MLPLKRSLLARIALSSFLLSFVIVLLLTFLGYSFFINGAEAKILQQMQDIAAVKEKMMEMWIVDRTRDAVELSSLFEVKRDVAVMCRSPQGTPEYAAANARLGTLFTGMGGMYPDAKQILLLSPQGGRIMFSTDGFLEGQYRTLDAFFIEGKKGTHVQNVYLSPISLEPAMTVSTPVGWGGEAPAVLAMNLDLDAMEGIIQDRTGLGRTGEAYLVDVNNEFVSSTRFGSAPYPRGVHSKGIDEAVAGRSGMGNYVNYAGIPVIGVYRWIPRRDIALVVEMRQEEAFQEATRQTFILIALGVAMAAIAAAAGYLLSRRIALPILAVERAAIRVSGGDLEAKAPVLTNDEIGELAKSFNLMTAVLKNLYDEIKRREERFRAIIEGSTDIIAICDQNVRFTYVSPSLKRVLGRTPEEVIGAELWGFLVPEEAPRIMEEVKRIMQSDAFSPAPLMVRAIHADGSIRTMEVTLRNLLSNPAVRGVVTISRDVTERVQLEDRLIQAQKMEAVGRLAGGIAHDFNNLLTAILGYADVLFESGPLDGESRGFVNEIRGAAERAASLTQQLLAFSRKQILQPRVVDVNALLADMKNIVKRLIGEDVEIVVRLAPDLRRVKADPSQLEQVVLNLAVNARDAMPEGGKLVLETDNADFENDASLPFPELVSGPYVVISVSDNGIGMDAETRSKIFDPFFTTKDKGKGTGLGLATVYGIVKQSGGVINVYSEKGRGSTFRVYLPATMEESAAPSPEPESRDLPRGTESILVTEDENAVRNMVGLILSQMGYAVRAFASPLEAIAHARSVSSIDLLVTDVVLPGMNGRRLSEEILALHPETKVLFISGYTEDAIVQHGIVREGTAFLQKPFLSRALAVKVRQVLDG